MIDRLIIFGILPESEYTVTWPDLNAPSDKDVAAVAEKRTTAMAKYVASGVDNLIAPFEFLTMVIGMSDDEVKAIETGALGFVGLEDIGLDPIEEDEPPTPIVKKKTKKKTTKKVVKKTKKKVNRR